jgi:hypothetical protein
MSQQQQVALSGCENRSAQPVEVYGKCTIKYTM